MSVGRWSYFSKDGLLGLTASCNACLLHASPLGPAAHFAVGAKPFQIVPDLELTDSVTLGSVCSLPVRQYHFIYDPKNWTEAQSHCRQRYTDLVTVDSLNMVTKLNGLADVSRMGSTADAWIGLYFDVVSWRWSLSDGGFYPADGSYRLWSPGEPNSAWYTADCAHMYDNGYWNDAPCQWLYGFICANTSGQTAAFFYINTLMNWTDAQSYCRLHYTDLASVRSLQENEQIRAARPAGLIVWIGLYKDTWKWSNGNLFLFSYWASGQPDGGLNNCTAADYSLSGRWEDWPCGLEKAFICYHGVQLEACGPSLACQNHFVVPKIIDGRLIAQRAFPPVHPHPGASEKSNPGELSLRDQLPDPVVLRWAPGTGQVRVMFSAVQLSCSPLHIHVDVNKAGILP
ncbi:hypothetical protein CCH79_00020664 [Gambusia affinis]|uniref:C-type lectin domain-containing protein n=1 Tax=Gambusia affinis TaxID=33528 RepID=A0A315VUM3_GAMAF|nr:hypothetical protein CCH79_00020664 [Gambusia affinis]